MNLYIQQWYKSNNLYELLKNDLLMRPAASVIIYSKYYNEIWLVGDCTGFYNGNIIENKLEVDELATKIRVNTLRYLLETGYSTTEELLENDISVDTANILRKSQQFIKNRNTGSKYDYTVIDGFDTVYELVKIVKIPDGVKEVILCSDGYPRVFPTLDESEQYLKYIAEKDPLCYTINPHFKGILKDQKAFDDRAYIRFEI